MQKEHELSSYIGILFKWRKIILIIIFITILFSFVVNFFVLKPVFRGSASVLIAYIDKNTILKPKDVQSIIESDQFIQKISEDLNVKSNIIKIGLSVNTTTDSKIIVVNFDSKNKDLIKKFFEIFIYEINNFTYDLFQTQINSYHEKINRIEKELEIIEKQQADLIDKIKNLEQKSSSKSEYALEYSLLINAYESISAKKIELIKDLNDTQLIVDNSKKFIYQNNPKIVDLPIKPRKILNIILTTMFSIIITLIFILFFEYYKTIKINNDK